MGFCQTLNLVFTKSITLIVVDIDARVLRVVKISWVGCVEFRLQHLDLVQQLMTLIAIKPSSHHNFSFLSFTHTDWCDATILVIL